MATKPKLPPSSGSSNSSLATKSTRLSRDVRLAIYFPFYLHRFQELGQYSEAMERMLVAESKRLDQRVTRQLKNMADEQRRQDYIEDMSEEWDQIAKTFPNTLRKSLAVQCAADFEHALVQLASYFQVLLESKLTLSDLRGEGIHKVKLFFEKVVGMDFPADSVEWNLAMAASELRNQLVHNDGHAPKDMSKLAKLAILEKKWGQAFSIAGKDIVLSAEFAPHLIAVYTTFLSALKIRMLEKLKE